MARVMVVIKYRHPLTGKIVKERIARAIATEDRSAYMRAMEQGDGETVRCIVAGHYAEYDGKCRCGTSGTRPMTRSRTRSLAK